MGDRGCWITKAGANSQPITTESGTQMQNLEPKSMTCIIFLTTTTIATIEGNKNGGLSQAKITISPIDKQLISKPSPY